MDVIQVICQHWITVREKEENMKIIIANAQVPFVKGGAEILADDLQIALAAEGHEVEQVKIPFKWYPPEKITEHILACRLLDLSESCEQNIDLLIGLKFPAYFLKHTNKVLWLLHQHRSAYDLWGTEFCDISSSELGNKNRDYIINSDNNFLPEAKKIFTISKNVSNRLKKFNNIESIPLYPPLLNPEKFFCNDFDDYIFYPSRINSIKRQHLAVEALKYTNTPVKLIIGGRPDTANSLQLLEEQISDCGVEGRVKIISEMSEDKKFTLYSNALGIIFIPMDEDYGYITLEALYSKKPVITATDSGGPLEFVDNDINGFVVTPDPKEVADAMDRLYMDKIKAKTMGTNGYEKILGLDLSWKRVVRELTR